MDFEIYTDGAYSSKRDQGGWSFVVIKDGIVHFKKFSGVVGTTNNRMELTAVIEALKYIRMHKLQSVTIYSDSMYVIGTLTMHWSINANHDLWSMLDSFDLSNISFIHVKGHADNPYNNLCDSLAVIGSQAKILD